MLDKGYLLRVVIKGTAAKQYQGVIGFNTAKYWTFFFYLIKIAFLNRLPTH